MTPAFAALVWALNLDLPKQNRSFGRLPAYLSDAFLIVGVGLGLLVVLALAIYLWMKFRKRRRRHISDGEKVFRDASEAAAVEDEANDESDDHDHEHGHSHHHGKRRFKYRVRRRTHRTRNPTLSETGGLPPVKTQEPTKPC